MAVRAAWKDELKKQILVGHGRGSKPLAECTALDLAYAAKDAEAKARTHSRIAVKLERYAALVAKANVATFADLPQSVLAEELTVAA